MAHHDSQVSDFGSGFRVLLHHRIIPGSAASTRTRTGWSGSTCRRRRAKLTW